MVRSGHFYWFAFSSFSDRMIDIFLLQLPIDLLYVCDDECFIMPFEKAKEIARFYLRLVLDCYFSFSPLYADCQFRHAYNISITLKNEFKEFVLKRKEKIVNSNNKPRNSYNSTFFFYRIFINFNKNHLNELTVSFFFLFIGIQRSDKSTATHPKESQRCSCLSVHRLW